MKDIADQLSLKWARKGSSWSFNLVDEMTRLTLDTIALCTMGKFWVLINATAVPQRATFFA